ncbi:MAG: GNAT family N-acetyltransferase [Crocinitomicaceae bacterium]|nr:GNAT family N-acetyltransferase [Crocinitomicaceae bacterium]
MNTNNKPIKTEYKKQVLRILTKSFGDNISTNFVIKQDQKKSKRLSVLMEYSIFYGERFGEVFLSKDKSACYIIIDPTKKKLTFQTLIWDMRLVFHCIGLRNLKKVMQRESLIKKEHPKEGFIHLWYIGVEPEMQGKGRGTELMTQIIAKAKNDNKHIYLETSTERNFKFYTSLGFKEKSTITKLGYPLKMFVL